MTTVYKIEIEVTSAWVNFPPEAIEKALMNLIEEQTDLESVEVKAIRKA